MRIVLIVSAVVVVLALALWFLLPPYHADTVFVNARMYGMTPEDSSFDAIVIRDGRIVELGRSQDMKERYRADTTLDLQGKTLLPGLVDAHAHIEGLGIALMTVDLVGAGSVEEVQHRVAQDLEHTGGASWVRGRGWDQTLWPGGRFPSCRDLDTVTRAVPVYLVRVDGHAAWVNSRVLQLAGIQKETPDPPGGRIMRDAEGNPTGVLIDQAIDLVRAVMPQPTRSERIRAVTLAMERCVSVGLTGVHDMGVDTELLEVYRDLAEQSKLPLRIYAAVDGPGPTWDSIRTRGALVGFADDHLTVRAVKLYADGALGSRGAALFTPYADDPGNRGLTLLSSGEMKQHVVDALQAGFQVCTHAIGDRANALVLDVYRDALRETGKLGEDARLRIEHAQVLAPEDIQRFSLLHVIPSMQPTHCTSDMRWASERLGTQRSAGAYAWRSLIDAGSIIPAGSDFPVESPDPLPGFYAAITRQDAGGQPPGGWHPEQRMTPEEALKAFTLWPAIASFRESDAGSLERGKRADFTVLSEDIMRVPAKRVLNVRVELTMVGGRVVYRGPAAPQL